MLAIIPRVGSLRGLGECPSNATQMVIGPERGLIVVFLVQLAGFPGRDGDKIFPTVMRAAIERFIK
jgi:hypothetical protein